MKICNSGHTEIVFEEHEECPTCALHDIFNIKNDDEVFCEDYYKCTEHNLFYSYSNGCRACAIEDDVEEFIQEHTRSCDNHGDLEDIYYYHGDECPACLNASNDNFDEKQKELEKEVERLKRKLQEKEEEAVTSCHERSSSGYEFL